MSIKISVIIPVYNAEKYISHCIDSLLEQTLYECEFIFVNDGSNDLSGEIIDAYKKIDSRVISIHQKNMGVSIARNNGLQKARGEYVGFVDADDYIERDMFENLYNMTKFHDCDVAVSNYQSEMEGRKVRSNYPFPTEIYLNKEYIEQYILPFLISSDFFNTVCTKIYRSSIILENNISFPENVPLGEDGIFNITFFCNASSMIYLKEAGYHYRKVQGSATRNIVDKDYFLRSLQVYEMGYPNELYKVINQEKLQRLKAMKLIHAVMSLIYIYFTPTKEITFKNRYKYIQNMITNENVRHSLPIFFDEMNEKLGNYEKFILQMMKRKSILGLFVATTYSRIRNN